MSGVKIFMANWKSQPEENTSTSRGKIPITQAKAVKKKHQAPKPNPIVRFLVNWYVTNTKGWDAD